MAIRSGDVEMPKNCFLLNLTDEQRLHKCALCDDLEGCTYAQNIIYTQKCEYQGEPRSMACLSCKTTLTCYKFLVKTRQGAKLLKELNENARQRSQEKAECFSLYFKAKKEPGLGI